MPAARDQSPPDPGGDDLERAGDTTWDTSAIEEGVYELRLRVSDAAANHPGEGREVWSRERLVLGVDRTPPEIDLRSSSGAEVELEVRDRVSPVRGLHVVDGERTLFRARPVDGVCDSRRETFRFRLPAQQAKASRHR